MNFEEIINSEKIQKCVESEMYYQMYFDCITDGYFEAYILHASQFCLVLFNWFFFLFFHVDVINMFSSHKSITLFSFHINTYEYPSEHSSEMQENGLTCSIVILSTVNLSWRVLNGMLITRFFYNNNCIRTTSLRKLMEGFSFDFQNI